MTDVTAAALPHRPARRARTLRVVAALVLREIELSNRRAVFGYLWEIVEPVAYIAVLMAVFSAVFTRPPVGESFALFYASGILPFLFFLNTANKVGAAVRASRQLLAYPEVTFLDAIAARFLLTAVTKLAVLGLVLGLIVTVFRVEPLFDVPALALGFGMTFLLALAVGAMNCLLFSVFPLWESVWTVVTRPLLLVSAVLHLFDQVPLPWRDILWWNPVIHLVGQVRAGLYPTYAGDYVSVLYVTGIAAVLLPAALFFLRRYWRELVWGD